MFCCWKRNNINLCRSASNIRSTCLLADRVLTSVGLWSRLLEPSPAHASALLAIAVYVLYANLRYSSIRIVR